MKNLNEKRMPFILFMVAFIGCVSLLFSCSSETDNVINEDKQEELSEVKTRAANDLPAGKVVASVTGNRFRVSWNSVLDKCDWGQSVSLYSSYLDTSIAGFGDRYPSQTIDKEIDIYPEYIGKEWGELSVRITACGRRVEFPLTYQGLYYYGETTLCEHKFEFRDAFVVINASDYGADITTGLGRGGKMVVEAKVEKINNTDKKVSRVFEKNIHGDMTTHLGWDWGVSTLHMGTVSITIRIYDSSCRNVDCNNYLEKTFSWSVPNSHGKYDASGYLNIIGG